RCAASGARKHNSAFPRRIAPELCMYLSPKRGRGRYPKGERGMPGARCTRSRACRIGSTRVSHHGRTGTPGIPAHDGVNGLPRTLPGDRALLSPSPPRSLLLENLTPTIEASGPHDFAVRKVTRSSVAHPRPSHPCPTFVTIAKRPSVWAGMG